MRGLAPISYIYTAIIVIRSSQLKMPDYKKNTVMDLLFNIFRAPFLIIFFPFCKGILREFKDVAEASTKERVQVIANNCFGIRIANFILFILCIKHFYIRLNVQVYLWNIYAKDNINMISISLLYICNIVAVFSNLMCMLRDSHSTKHNGQVNDGIQYKKDTTCEKCNSVQEPEHHHCDICNKCTQRNWNHNIYINNCISKRNYMWYLLMVNSDAIISYLMVEGCLEIFFRISIILVKTYEISYMESFRRVFVSSYIQMFCVFYFGVQIRKKFKLAKAENKKFRQYITDNEKVVNKQLIQQISTEQTKLFLHETVLEQFNGTEAKTAYQLKKILKKFLFYDFLEQYGKAGINLAEQKKMDLQIPIIASSDKNSEINENNTKYIALDNQISVQLLQQNYNFYSKGLTFSIFELLMAGVEINKCNTCCSIKNLFKRKPKVEVAQEKKEE